MNDNLKYTFSNINDWLKFAEAKNAGLLALNVATIIGVLQCNKELFGAYLTMRVILIVAFCISSSICVYSLSPIVNKTQLFKKLTQQEFDAKKQNMNHLFFGNIASLNSLQFQELYTLKSSITLSDLDKDLIDQIVQNSEITLQKFKVFNLAAYITFIGFVVSMVTVVLIAF